MEKTIKLPNIKDIKPFAQMIRVALYIRVSTEEQARHGLSLEDQRRALEQYAKSHKMVVVDVYEDAGISARKSYKRRPELVRLLEDCKAGKIDVILFVKLDRWFRNVGNYYAVQDILDQCGVTWRATQEDYETATASGRLKVNIMLSVAQDEADRTSERIKFVFDAKRARGEPLGGNVPTGYIIKDKSIQKDPKLDPAISAFFDYYIKYGKLTSAIDFVAEQYGYRMQYQLASNILKKRAYCGDFNGIPCPSYITEEQYRYIQTRRRKQPRKTKYTRIYLFSGLVVCGECGRRVIHRTHRYKDKENAECNCPGHYQRCGCQNNSNIRETEIETFLMDHIEEQLSELEAIYIEREQKKRGQDISSELSSVKRKMSRLKDLYVNDLIDLETYKVDFAKYSETIDRLEKIQSSTPKSLESVRKIICEGWKYLYSELDREKKQAFWRSVIKEIRVYSGHKIEFDFLTT